MYRVTEEITLTFPHQDSFYSTNRRQWKVVQNLADVTLFITKTNWKIPGSAELLCQWNSSLVKLEWWKLHKQRKKWNKERNVEGHPVTLYTFHTRPLTLSLVATSKWYDLLADAEIKLLLFKVLTQTTKALNSNLLRLQIRPMADIMNKKWQKQTGAGNDHAVQGDWNPQCAAILNKDEGKSETWVIILNNSHIIWLFVFFVC